MKMNKRITAILLTVLAVLLVLPLQALAAGRIDLTRGCGLTISYQDGTVPLAGAYFALYRVADVDETGELTITEDYAEYNVSVDIRGENDEAWRTLASTLEGYTLGGGVKPTDSGTTDVNGQLTFPTGENQLLPGLYLVLGSRHRQGGMMYDAQPFLVLLPALDMDANDWNYDVTVTPKHESRPEPNDTVDHKVLKVWKDDGHEEERPREITIQLLRDGQVYDTVTLSAENNWRYTWEDLDDGYRWTAVEETPEGYTVELTRESTTFVVTNTWDQPDTPPATPSTPDGPSLPQTGQLWWPVPLLLCVGLLFIVVGLNRRRGMSDEAQ